MPHPHSTERLSDRVADDVHHRPDYPVTLVDGLRREHGVDAPWEVAGTGVDTRLSAKPFLDAGHRVSAVAPHAPRRAAAELWLGENPNFRALDGRIDLACDTRACVGHLS